MASDCDADRAGDGCGWWLAARAATASGPGTDGHRGEVKGRERQQERDSALRLQLLARRSSSCSSSSLCDSPGSPRSLPLQRREGQAEESKRLLVAASSCEAGREEREQEEKQLEEAADACAPVSASLLTQCELQQAAQRSPSYSSRANPLLSPHWTAAPPLPQRSPPSRALLSLPLLPLRPPAPSPAVAALPAELRPHACRSFCSLSPMLHCGLLTPGRGELQLLRPPAHIRSPSPSSSSSCLLFALVSPRVLLCYASARSQRPHAALLLPAPVELRLEQRAGEAAARRGLCFSLLAHCCSWRWRQEAAGSQLQAVTTLTAGGSSRLELGCRLPEQLNDWLFVLGRCQAWLQAEEQHAPAPHTAAV